MSSHLIVLGGTSHIGSWWILNQNPFLIAANTRGINMNLNYPDLLQHPPEPQRSLLLRLETTEVTNTIVLPTQEQMCIISS